MGANQGNVLASATVNDRSDSGVVFDDQISFIDVDKDRPFLMSWAGGASNCCPPYLTNEEAPKES
jgi:hypothetical protein